MTIEELDIIVEASIKPAMDEIKKLIPQVRKQTSQIKKEFNKLNISNIKPQINMQSVQKEIQKVKKNMKEVFDPNDVSGIKITGNLGKEITGISNKFRQLKGSTGDLERVFDFTRYQRGLQQLEDAKGKVNNVPAHKYDTTAIQKFVDSYGSATMKASQLKRETEQVASSQNKISVYSKSLNQKLNQARNSTNAMKKNLKQMPKYTQNITNNIKQIGTGFKNGLSQVLKYAGALLGIRTIYGILRNSAQSWLSSQNTGAQQLSANIEYMKYAMGSVFAPVIEYVTNLIYKLMKALQSLVYAFSGINIFAKATASSMNKTAGSASKASKSLAGVHTEINNVAEKDNGIGGGGSVSPDIDLSQVDNSMAGFFDKWKSKLSVLFEPFKKAWENQGQATIDKVKGAVDSIKETVGSMANSWEQVWINGTGQQMIELVLQILQNIFDIITNISDAWRNAWESDDAGTKLIQTIYNVLNKLFELIKKITDKIKEFTSNPIVQEYFENAIKMVTNFWNALGGVLDFLTGVFTGDWEKAWDGLKTFVESIFGLIWNIINSKLIMVKGIITNALDSVKNIWNNIWEGIKNFASNIWNALLDKIDSIFPGMRNIIETNIINAKNKMTEILNNIKNTWNNIWEGLKNKISDIWNGIKSKTQEMWNGIYNVIRNPINSILEGVEKMANGVVSGVNKVIRALNNMHFKMPDWLGGGTFGINIPLASYVSLPRLAKGNVAYSPIVAQFGEYAGARNNPEITAPQNILAETFRNEMADFFASNNNNRPTRIQLMVGANTFIDEVIDGINEKTRSTGKAQIKVAYE